MVKVSAGHGVSSEAQLGRIYFHACVVVGQIQFPVGCQPEPLRFLPVVSWRWPAASCHVDSPWGDLLYLSSQGGRECLQSQGNDPRRGLDTSALFRWFSVSRRVHPYSTEGTTCRCEHREVEVIGDHLRVSA